mmetsp:Transcript_70606/g.159719  ORF Transcript_70606/g.159719 Transcript_70606/m.159719 type:complete len:218 (+) Transcript_70606:171-824(+)
MSLGFEEANQKRAGPVISRLHVETTASSTYIAVMHIRGLQPRTEDDINQHLGFGLATPPLRHSSTRGGGAVSACCTAPRQTRPSPAPFARPAVDVPHKAAGCRCCDEAASHAAVALLPPLRPLVRLPHRQPHRPPSAERDLASSLPGAKKFRHITAMSMAKKNTQHFQSGAVSHKPTRHQKREEGGGGTNHPRVRESRSHRHRHRHLRRVSYFRLSS